MSGELIRYDAMVLAIAECHRIDEIKQIHNQAAAFEAASRIAMNTDAERQAVEIRIRAERRAGELMREMQKTPPEKAAKKSPATAAGESEYRQSIKSAGIPERTAQRWQNLAEVPKARFEAHLSQDEKPSTRAIIDSIKTKPRMSEEALWLWGRLRDFERKGMIDCDPEPLIDELTDAMRHDVQRLAPLIVNFLNRCTEKEVA